MRDSGRLARSKTSDISLGRLRLGHPERVPMSQLEPPSNPIPTAPSLQVAPLNGLSAARPARPPGGTGRPPSRSTSLGAGAQELCWAPPQLKASRGAPVSGFTACRFLAALSPAGPARLLSHRKDARRPCSGSTCAVRHPSTCRPRGKALRASSCAPTVASQLQNA